MDTCIHGHELRVPSDRLVDGGCRKCHRTSQARYDARRKAALEFAKVFERAGQLDLSAYVD